MKPEQSSRYELYLDAFFVPTRTLSFDAKYRFVNQENFNTTLQNYFVNWSPFPDGDLQFFFKYSETLNSQNDRKERVIGPGLNWTISRHFFLEMFYNIVKTEDNAQEINSNNLYAEFRINF